MLALIILNINKIFSLYSYNTKNNNEPNNVKYAVK